MIKMLNKCVQGLVLCILLFLFCCESDSPPSHWGSGHDGEVVPVVKVHDGDTFSVILGGKREKVRCIGIDAPELGQAPWGRRASEYLVSLIKDSGWRVQLETDVEKRDKYGRILAYVRTSDGRLVNQLMIKYGYAMLFTVPPNVKYIQVLTASQEDARFETRGIWGEGGLRKTPWDYRRSHPRR